MTLQIQPIPAATPPCPHFGPCGGCQLQHLPYPAQLALKATQLQTLLAPLNLPLPELQLHPSPPFAYRNRIRLTLAVIDGRLRAGYLRNPTPPETTTLSILPITQCPIAAPILWRAAEAFLALVHQSPTPWLGTPQHKLDQLELFTTADESQVQFTLYLRTQSKAVPPQLATAFTTLCESLRSQIPELTGAGIALLPPASPARSRRTELPRPGPAWGAPGLNYSVAIPPLIDVPSPRTTAPSTTYWVPRTAFFQVNRFLLPELLALITEQVALSPDKSLAWDLYAGVGLFARPLAQTFAHVTAVEIASLSFTALAAGSKTGKLPNLQAVQATTLDFLRAAVLQRDHPSLIVLDPPRSGAGPEICALLARIAAPTLIYVSCSPQHLAADLLPLTASGYRIANLHLLDLFPQTTHLETLAILTR